MTEEIVDEFPFPDTNTYDQNFLNYLNNPDLTIEDKKNGISSVINQLLNYEENHIIDLVENGEWSEKTLQNYQNCYNIASDINTYIYRINKLWNKFGYKGDAFPISIARTMLDVYIKHFNNVKYEDVKKLYNIIMSPPCVAKDWQPLDFDLEFYQKEGGWDKLNLELKTSLNKQLSVGAFSEDFLDIFVRVFLTSILNND